MSAGRAGRRVQGATDARIAAILVAIALTFEALGWLTLGQSFLFNAERLFVIVLQVSVIGIIAIGVTQVMILGGIDLSGGSVAAFAAMVAASFAQSANAGAAAYFPALVDLPAAAPLLVGLLVGAAAGLINGAITALTSVPSFIPTLGMLVFARGLAVFWGRGSSVTQFTESFTALGAGLVPVIAFATVAALFHFILGRTLYGRRAYAIGSNEAAARASGIDVKRHKIIVFTIAGALSGFAGVIVAAQATMAQPAMGTGYELDAISAAVVGGASLLGGRGRVSGTVIGVLILGVITSGFTMLRIDSDYQAVVKGLIILSAVAVDQWRHDFASARVG